MFLENEKWPNSVTSVKFLWKRRVHCIVSILHNLIYRKQKTLGNPSRLKICRLLITHWKIIHFAEVYLTHFKTKKIALI